MNLLSRDGRERRNGRMEEQMFLAQYLEHELKWDCGVSGDPIAIIVLFSPAGLPSLLLRVK